jgi:glycosyltransferase involved in cell wall biosynthesis
MRLSIVTPSFRASSWLKLCIASVADQEGVELEHIVQDAGSDDGTLTWLPHEKRVKAFIEKDSGMYDAINRGLRRSSGDILAYLNSDEQYLPGALRSVHDAFASDPELDVLLADSIVTDTFGNYLCHRVSLVPGPVGMWVRFPVLTSSLFVRREVVHQKGLWFDQQWKDLGDWFWVMEMVRHKLRFSILPQFTSVFADTGDNMNLKPNGARERRLKWQMAPAWVKALRYPLIAHYRLRVLTRPPLRRKPFTFSLYTLESPTTRVVRHAKWPTSFWGKRRVQTEEPLKGQSLSSPA